MSDDLLLAKELMDRGDYSSAHRVLLPLVEGKVPEAIFLASTFSVGDSESEEEFELRSFEMLRESAELGFPAAMFALAGCYQTGDLVQRNEERAEYWLNMAYESGYVQPNKSAEE